MVQFEASKGVSNYQLAQITRDLSIQLNLNVTETNELPPVFETERKRLNEGRFVIGSNLPKSRFNLVTAGRDIRVTLQHDRFGITWIRQKDIAYPRFENISEQFFEIFSKFKECLSTFFEISIKIAQAEVQYVNVINDADGQALKYFNFIDVSKFRDYEGIQFATSQRLTGFPEVGRLYLEAQSEFVLKMIGKAEAVEERVLKVYVTFRGLPSAIDNEGMKNFLIRGRSAIVNTFSRSLSDEGKEFWGEKER